MERYVWVKNARARFADVLNTAAYGSERVVILRRGEELGAFIGLAFHQRIAQQRGASAVELEALAEQLADLQRLRAYYGPSPPGEKAN